MRVVRLNAISERSGSNTYIVIYMVTTIILQITTIIQVTTGNYR